MSNLSGKKPNDADNDKGDLRKFVTDEAMIRTLNKKGIAKLFPIQYETFPFIQKGEDLVAKDRTGSGKTLAFSLPIILKMRKEGKFRGAHKPRFLVVLPTRYSNFYSGNLPSRSEMRSPVYDLEIRRTLLLLLSTEAQESKNKLTPCKVGLILLLAPLADSLIS